MSHFLSLFAISYLWALVPSPLFSYFFLGLKWIFVKSETEHATYGNE
jgi:hypothetical protein